MVKGTKGGRALLVAVVFGKTMECVEGPEEASSLTFSLLLGVLLGVEGKAERRRGVPFMAFSAPNRSRMIKGKWQIDQPVVQWKVVPRDLKLENIETR